ncbi:TonB-dependent receptor [Methylobacillus pratensis]
MRPPVKSSRSCRLAALISLAFPGAFASVLAFAAEKANEEDPSIVLDAIEVQAAPEELTNSLDPSSTLSGKELMLKSAATLGATLQDELGVANATFGPNVGLPLIRGQHGPRTRVMVNGVGTHDASAMSPDHGTTVESLLAKEIKVLRGPATIRNGGGAIGGAVEITDGRIPERLPTKTKVTTQLRFNTNHDERIMATELLTKAGQVAFHVDVHGRESNNIHVPGMAIDQDAIKQIFGSELPNNTHGYTDNTNARSKGGSVGASVFGEMGYVGISLSHYANNYGIPMGPAHSHPGAPAVEAERVRIDMQQDRIDLKGELFLPYKWLESIALRIGKSNYHHDELSNGMQQTRFSNDVIEHRLEFNHRLFPNLTGTLGFHGINRDFSALGVEAFVPESKIGTKGFYLIETLDFHPWQLELGIRKEESTLSASAQPIKWNGALLYTKADFRKKYNPESYSLALKRAYKTGSITINRWIARRAPDIQELAAFGPHLATRTYDIGNGDLETETLNGWDIRLQQKLGRLETNLNLFTYAAKNYIYQQNAGCIYMEANIFRPQKYCTGGLASIPLINMRYEQQDASFHGYEAEIGLPLQIPGMRKFRASVFADQVRGMLDDNTHVPRLTPARHGLLVQAGMGKWDSDIRLTHFRAQKRTGTMPIGDEMLPEPGTDSYNRVDIALRRSIEVPNWFTGDLFINMRNVTNAEIRNSTSFLRYYTPELGRNIEIGMRIDL